MLIEPISSGFTVCVTRADCITSGAYGANVSDSPKPSILDLFLGWMNIGLTSVGGAGGPLRHVIVKQRRWLSEGELAETFGIAQALPGATAVNVAVLMSDRFCGALGPLASLLGLILPTMLVAIALAGFATQLAAVNPRFAAAEVAITASVCGVFISNGIRLISQMWTDAPDVAAVWRGARVAISLLGIVLVAGFHVFIPFVVVILIALSMLVEVRAGTT
jgi:chromate transporter